MSHITAIVPARRRPGRFDVLIDGKPDVTLSIEAVERLHLSVGAAMDEQLSALLRDEAALLATYDRALNLLALRARSAAELRRLLLRKGEPASHVERAVDRLVQAGFLDDASFARQFTRSRVLGAGLSRRRVQGELARRGVARELADAAIDEVFAEESVDEEDTLERVARKKLKSLARFDEATRRRRLFAFLARRGYDVDDIGRVVRVLAAQDGDGETKAEGQREGEGEGEAHER
jgi:regulatory protein